MRRVISKRAGLAIGCFRRVLIVEDDDLLRRVLVRLVSTWQAEVLEARCGAEGIELLATAPDLVILDIRLPDDSGVNVAEAASRLDPAPAIIAISGAASAVEAFRLAQLGVRVYIQKPFSVEYLCEKARDAYETSRNSVPSSSFPATLDERDPAALMNNLGAFAREYKLTPRQKTLVRLAVSGVPRKRFPEMLGISENTCKTMTRRLLRKCGARSLADIPRLILFRGQEPTEATGP